MRINVKDLSINYIQYGKGKDILLLHGWGQNIEMMRPLGDNFFDNYRITILDMPGFGESDDLKEAWNINDYVNFLLEFLDKLGVKKPIVMGHSFGGRVAIVLSTMCAVDKVVLFGSPCVREKKELSFGVKVLKTIKRMPFMDKLGEYMKNYIGSRDYKAASPIMRQTLVNVVNEDLSDYAKKIDASVLLIWGDNDSEAPVEDAKKLEAILKDGGLVILPGTHYAYLENLAHVVNIINNFI